MKIKLSNTSKMPCKSWGIPATTCKKGAELAKIKGSVCSGCYALKGAYSWPKVKNAYQVRLEQYQQNPSVWYKHMIEIIEKESKRQIKQGNKQTYFRWFDSGDLQNIGMLQAIIQIAYNLPHVNFWLPTREKTILNNYFKQGNRKPDNLTIRLSDNMIDKNIALPKKLNDVGILQSGVTTNEDEANCHSFKQHGKCLECRACWDSKNKITYLKH
jgi:hypothetical protein